MPERSHRVPTKAGRRRAALAGAVVWALLAGAPAIGAAQGQPPSPPSPAPPSSTAAEGGPIATIEVDLATATLPDRLPFERPLHFTGGLPPGFSADHPAGGPARATLRSIESKKPLTGTEAICTSDALPAECSEKRDRCRESSFAGDVGADNRFLFRVPGVPPNRFFFLCFGFESAVGGAALDEFRARARPLLDQLVARTDGELAPGQAEELIKRLRAELDATLDQGEVLIPEGTFLDPANAAAAENQFERSFNPVWQAQKDVALQLAGDPDPDLGAPSFEELQQRLLPPPRGRAKAALEPLVGNQDLAMLAGQLATARRFNALLDQELGRFEGALALAAALSAPAPESTAALAGIGLTTAELEPARMFALTAQDAAALLARLDKNAADLQGLSRLIDEVQEGARLGATPVQEQKTLAAALGAELLGGLRALDVDAAADLAAASAERMRRIASDLGNREAALTAAVDDQLRLARSIVSVVDATSVIGSTQQSPYFSVEAGTVAIPVLDEVVPYSGVNFYLRPVNPPTITPLGKSLLRRFAFTLGLTLDGVDETQATDAGGTEVIDNLFGNQNLLLGAGLRLNRMVRLGAGAVVYRQREDVLDRSLSLTTTWYVALSFDMDVQSALTGDGWRLFNGGNGSPGARPPG